jgi:hypothetical protein
MGQKETRNTNTAMIITFIVVLILGIIVISLTTCSTTYKGTKFNDEITHADQYVGIINHYSYPIKKDKSDTQCPYTTTLYIKLNDQDNHPLIIKICGHHGYIETGDKVWIRNGIPINYHDHNKFVITGGYIHPMLE